MEDKIYKRKILILYIACGVVIYILGLLTGLLIAGRKHRPIAIFVTDKAWELGTNKEVGTLVEDNFWRFARSSYILIGDYPNYQYYKIVNEVPRHNFNIENFYIEEGTDRMYYHDDAGHRESTIVIDVSTFQTDIDWEAVKDSGIDMAIIRVGYRGYGTGALVEDEMFRSHYEGAVDAGVKVGVYFFSQALNTAEGVEEAEFVLDTIKDLKIEGPVVIDSEGLYVDDETRTDGLGIDERTDSVVGFLDTVREAGYEPMIYANRNWFVQELDMKRLGEYKLWLALYANNLAFPYQIAGWQYTSEGHVEGIAEAVDLNVWFQD